MNPAIVAALVAILVAPSAIDGPEYSFTEGIGQFCALRHHKPGAAPYVEVIGSGIAMKRAKKQARDGGYTLDIKGPFSGYPEALAFIRKEWDPRYGKPKKPVYTGTPHPNVTHSPEEVKESLPNQ
jgi:hypothetical protein